MSEIDKEYEIPIVGNSDEEVTQVSSSSVADLSETEPKDKKDVENNHLEMLQRLKAEFENFKKRVERENMELSTFIKSQLIYKLLPVVDDFERMLNNSHAESEEVVKGIKLIYDKLISILEDEGLQQIESIGKDFNPEIHEAVLIESGDDNQDNKILEEWQKGYLFKSKLLRPAKVKVCQTTQKNNVCD